MLPVSYLGCEVVMPVATEFEKSSSLLMTVSYTSVLSRLQTLAMHTSDLKVIVNNKSLTITGKKVSKGRVFRDTFINDLICVIVLYKFRSKMQKITKKPVSSLLLVRLLFQYKDIITVMRISQFKVSSCLFQQSMEN